LKNKKVPIADAGFNDWLSYVEGYVELFRRGKNIAFNELVSRHIHSATRSAAKVVICSPHPDDETLTGLLPLRLLQESGAVVVNLAVTLGSDPHRKNDRQKELHAACSVLGFQLHVFDNPPDFNKKNPWELSGNSDEWRQQIDNVISFFEQEKPAMVICPHGGDGHPAHAGTNFLILQALLHFSTIANKEIIFAESEFWQPLKNPNVLVGAHAGHVAKLVCALAQHRGEMSRVPYHLYLPARMMDNVRRGGELVKGYGQTGADFLFGELYRLSVIKKGRQVSAFENEQVLGPELDLGLSVFKRNLSAQFRRGGMLGVEGPRFPGKSQLL
jgi:LmbE family N-acetylglucosaminyl deacetylase